MSIKSEFRRLMRRMGYEKIKPRPMSEALIHRQRLFAAYEIETVIDVGANIGQYALQLRKDLAYAKLIVSFEPLKSAYELLRSAAAGDPHWRTFNFALGDTNERKMIHVAGNSQSSSFLEMLPAHETAAPESKYVGQQEIEIKTLDCIFDEICANKRHVYLKIDTQGFESKVIAGGEHALAFIDTVQLEMSLAPLYEGEPLFDDMCSTMKSKGYSLVAIEPGFSDKRTRQLLQLDGIFHRL